MPSSLSAHPSLSIPALDAFQLQLTPFNSTPAAAADEKKKNQPVMTFVHVFDRPDEAYYFCYSYPFSYSHQQRLLSDLERRRLPFVTRELLCRSVQNRRCDVLMIGDQTRYKHRGVTNKRKVILLTCRVHPGETPSSHTLRGFIDWLTSDDPHAVALRLHVTFVIVPMLNPDGCFHGNYRTDSLGTDLNRAWENPTEFEPTLLAVRSLAKTYAEDSTVELDFYIDCHAHTTSKASFLFVNPPEESDSAEAWERVAALPRLVDLNCEGSALGFSLAACKFCSDPSKSGSARHALRDLLLKRGASKAMCYTLEMSFYSPPNAQKTWTATTSNEASYEAFGRAMGDSFADYYGLRSDAAYPRQRAVMTRVERARKNGGVDPESSRKKNGGGSDSFAFIATGDAMFGLSVVDASPGEKPWKRFGGVHAHLSEIKSRAEVGDASLTSLSPRWNGGAARFGGEFGTGAGGGGSGGKGKSGGAGGGGAGGKRARAARWTSPKLGAGNGERATATAATATRDGMKAVPGKTFDLKVEVPTGPTKRGARGKKAVKGGTVKRKPSSPPPDELMDAKDARRGATEMANPTADDETDPRAPPTRSKSFLDVEGSSSHSHDDDSLPDDVDAAYFGFGYSRGDESPDEDAVVASGSAAARRSFASPGRPGGRSSLVIPPWATFDDADDDDAADDDDDALRSPGLRLGDMRVSSDRR